MYKLHFKRLKNWFLNEKRDLPWRNSPTPYAVWISEVMLQQTQVAVVIPYFERWMQRFPSISSLAEAKLDEVIKLWEGLGYYSRARSLHEGAQFVMQHFQGELPDDAEKLSEIKGLGPYTVAAILSFAFRKKAAAVDGNVLRVLSRYFSVEEDIAKAKTINKMREIAWQILPDNESWIQNEALIELGATICKKKPKCIECPLRPECKAFIHGSTDRLPFKSSKVVTEYLYRIVPVITSGNKFLIQRGQKGKVMSDLHEFPYFETNKKGWSLKKVLSELNSQWSLKLEYVKQLPDVQHSFTKFQVKLTPILFHCRMQQPVEGHEWFTESELKQLAFSSGHRRIFEALTMGD